ncbi:Z1 domain-containing protein [Azospirillum aestuarii]|uniref:Z1 domain-containing protein n=1 Tax=Azospirillum aestuarii TaxID=2802052 RepID=UPI0040552FBD
MSDSYDAALAVSQILISNLIKAGGQPLTSELIRAQAVAAAGLVGGGVDAERLARELAAHFDVFVRDATVLVDDAYRTPWLDRGGRDGWRFWPRCEKLMLSSLPKPVVEQIDDDTDRILGLLENPAKEGAWYIRGLVVGNVQSGKTSNYAALACKAADVGYRLIIVLAGMHESLRMQTQMRMEELFLGFRTDPTSHALTGVGLIDPSPRAVAATSRSLRGDFNRAISKQLVVPLDLGPPLLLVVKKNAKTLDNLRKWLQRDGGDNAPAAMIRGVPALVIDDESDNASVDTIGQTFGPDNKPDLNFEPTAINSLIRKILRLFEKKAYVGYTATPFANIFIHHAAATDKAESDLFPRDFIVNLHPPSNYFGPIQAFGLEETDENAASATRLVRLIDESPVDAVQLERWMPRRHKQDHVPQVDCEDGIPTSLRRALMSFALACGVRRLRGQVGEHNSMLVHVTRFTRVQNEVYEQISETLVRIRRRLRYEDDQAGSLWAEFATIWTTDFVPTTARMHELGFADAGPLPPWPEIEAILTEVVSGIRVKQINGQAQDVLDYESHRSTGIDIIAVGGDKLSRGLTLEGLTVSYFTRQSDMYDTLLQMGRWFGYRPRYLDLCRLYTTKLLNEAFEHITIATDELRREFDYMQNVNFRPIDFGLRVRGHALLAPTSAGKRRHTRDVVVSETYAGKVSEAKSFSLAREVLNDNLRSLEDLVSHLRAVGKPESPSYTDASGGGRSYENALLWRQIPAERVCDFLADYVTEPTARLANSQLWIKYIRDQHRCSGELAHWNIALFSGADGDPYQIGGIDLRARLRKRDEEVAEGAGYHIRRLLTNRDAGIDLEPRVWDAARAYDPMNRLNGERRREPTSQANCWARQRFSVSPLLAIYLPQPDDYDRSLPPVVGVAIAFPGSDNAVTQPVRYTVNSVYLAGAVPEYEDEE